MNYAAIIRILSAAFATVTSALDEEYRRGLNDGAKVRPPSYPDDVVDPDLATCKDFDVGDRVLIPASSEATGDVDAPETRGTIFGFEDLYIVVARDDGRRGGSQDGLWLSYEDCLVMLSRGNCNG